MKMRLLPIRGIRKRGRGDVCLHCRGEGIFRRSRNDCGIKIYGPAATRKSKQCNSNQQSFLFWQKCGFEIEAHLKGFCLPSSSQETGYIYILPLQGYRDLNSRLFVNVPSFRPLKPGRTCRSSGIYFTLKLGLAILFCFFFLVGGGVYNSWKVFAACHWPQTRGLFVHFFVKKQKKLNTKEVEEVTFLFAVSLVHTFCVFSTLWGATSKCSC